MANIYGKTVGGLLSEAASNAYNTVYGIGAHMANNPKTAGLLAGQFVPGAATADFYGRYPDPMNPSQTLPSAGQNLARGQYLDAALQSAGLVGDIFYSAAPYTAGAAAVPGAALSAPRAAQLAKRAADGKKTASFKPEIIAYHGSPYNFDKFSLANVNTGEGAQAFGHGLYFTDSEDIAEFYKNTIKFQKDVEGKSLTYNNKPLDLRDMGDNLNAGEKKLLGKLGDELPIGYDVVADPENIKAKTLKDLVADLEEAIAEFRSGTMGDFFLEDGTSYNETQALKLEEMIAQAKAVDLTRIGELTPKTYKVGLAPKLEELLDYDKPFGEQNEFIKERLKKVADELNRDDAVNLGFDPFDYGGSEKAAIEAAKKSLLDDETPVVRFLNDFAVLRGNLGAGEELLNKYGIKGIKYKANQGVGARNVPETGANNYVIFDENLVEILKKYGIFGPVAVGAATTAGVSGLLDDEPKTGGGLL